MKQDKIRSFATMQTGAEQTAPDSIACFTVISTVFLLNTNMYMHTSLFRLSFPNRTSKYGYEFSRKS